jgi:hypothetical protein
MILSSTRKRFRTVGVVIVCALLGACGSRESDASKPATDPLAGLTLHSYTVRGEVVSLPTDTTDLQVHHEAIPEFKNPDGSLGMDTMIMPFWPPQGLSKDDPRIAARIAKFSLDGVEVGEPVELTFEVVWDADGKILGFYAASIAPLPPGTVLDYSALEPDPKAAQ